MENYSVIGKSVPKIDGPAKVTGQAKYTGDLKFPNMLVGKILTSPHPHARILNIDTSEAEKLPGVKAVITHKDVPSLKYGLSPARWDENIFCIDKVRFVGDKVAAVAALDEDTVYKALKLIKVEYEVLPAVLDPIEALAEGAPLVHDEYPGEYQRRNPPEFRQCGKGVCHGLSCPHRSLHRPEDISVPDRAPFSHIHVGREETYCLYEHPVPPLLSTLYCP